MSDFDNDQHDVTPWHLRPDAWTYLLAVAAPYIVGFALGVLFTTFVVAFL
jgi:hypothetical protein